MANYRLRTVRPKAPWGAVVPAVISGISSIAGMISNSASARRQQQLAEEQLALQKKQLGYQAESARAQALNQVIPNMADTYDYTKDVYANGGSVGKQSNPIIIQAGGTASTFKDKLGKKVVQFHGNTHEQVNEAGGTGEYVNIARKDIEVEDKELASRVGNHYTIISNRLPAGNGKSLAQAVKDKDITFKQAERMQNKIKRLRTTSPVGRMMGRPKALTGMTFTPGDYISLGVNTILPFFAHRSGRGQYDKSLNVLNDYKAYLDKYDSLTMPAYRSMNTDFNRHWLRGETMQQGSDAIQQIGRNTASANVGRNLMQATNTDTQAALNKILGEDQEMNFKARIADNEQRNSFNLGATKALADYRAQMAGIRGDLAAQEAAIWSQKYNDNTALIQSLGTGVGNFLQQGRDNYDRNTRDAILMASLPDGALERLYGIRPQMFDRSTVDNMYGVRASQYNYDPTDVNRQRMLVWEDGLRRSRRPIRLRSAVTPMFRNARFTPIDAFSKYRQIPKISVN